MSGPVNLNGMKTASPPNAFGAILWFRDTDNRLQRMPVARPSAVTNPLGFKAASEPMPSPDGYIFFQGTDNKLWMMQQQTPYLNVNLGGFECKSPPICAGDGWVFFQGTDDKLWQVSNVDPSINLNLGGLKCISTPAVPLRPNGYLFFQGPDNSLWRGRYNIPITATSMAASNAPRLLNASNNGNLYFQGTYNAVWEVDMLDPKKNRRIGNWQCKSTPKTTEFGENGFVYFQSADNNKLMEVPLDNPTKGTNLYNMQTKSTPDLQGDRYVYFQGTDDKLWQCPTTK